MADALERILAELDKRGILRSAGEDALYEDIADAIWLAAHFPDLLPLRNQVAATPNGSGTLPAPNPEHARDESPPSKWHSPVDSLIDDPESLVETVPRSGVAQLKVVEKKPKSIKLRHVGFPQTPAWQHTLGIERALRPLARRKASKGQWEMDESETASLIAESGIFQAALRPLPARWLEAVFIIERSPTMRVWSQPALEFQRILWRVGAFRWAKTFFWDGFQLVDKTSPRLISLIGNVEHDPKKICHPGAPRVIFFCSDCVGPAWRDGTIPRWLETWSKNNLTVVLQTLPKDEWRRTTLRHTDIIEGTARIPLSVPHIAGECVIPVASLSDTQSLQDLARFITAAPHNRVSCFSSKTLIEKIKPLSVVVSSNQSPQDLTAEQVEERFRRFMEIASSTALDLARYMASAPLYLPYMRLIQQQLLPDAHPAHLAEIFNSGILRKIKNLDEKKRPIEENDNDVEYEFIAAGNFDIRRWLLGQRSKAKTEKVEELIEEHLPAGTSLIIPILDYQEAEDDGNIGDLSESVKSSSSARWKRLGHYDLANRLESAFIQEKEKSMSLSTEEQNVHSVFDLLESTEKYLHIYGPHGIGKTRFVKRLLEEFPDRSAYIDVAGNEQVLELLRKAYSALYSESDVAQLSLAEIAQQWAKKVQARSASYDVIVLDHFDRFLAPSQMADELRKTILPSLEKNIPQAALRLRFIIVAQMKNEVLCERNYPDLIKNWAVSS